MTVGTNSRAILLLAAAGLAIATAGAVPLRNSTADEVDAAPKFDAQAIEFFEKSVRPILVDRCYQCHSAKAEKLQGGLRLDSRAAVLLGGETGLAIVPGDAKASRLIDAVNYGEFEMPPKSKLPKEEIAALTKWVELGAPWPDEATAANKKVTTFDLEQRRAAHWVWQPIGKPQPPPVEGNEWPRTSVDRFIFASLTAKGLAPAEPADKRTLIRRLYFDLIGLPPSREQIDAFLTDDSASAVERVVDELLDSPHFGERWARHWLDLVRYAETRGHEFEPLIPNAWQYRDYLIRALNADVPYDQFVTEHIAGDLLDEPRLHPEAGFNESILGTGFWFLGEEVHSPVDIRQDEADRLDNRLDVMTKTFLGITVGCARCHDHKFDAISQADYYALTGFLLSSTYRQVGFESYDHNRRIAHQLEVVQQQAGALLGTILNAERPAVDQMSQYLLAARDVIRADAKVADKAADQKLSAELLSQWVAELTAANNAPTHPLHAFAKIALAADDQAQTFEAAIKPWRDELQRATASPVATSADGKAPPERVIVDYANQQTSAWYADGFTFGLRPTRPGDVRLSGDPKRPIAKVIDYRIAERDPAWNKLKTSAGSERDHGGLGSWERSGRTIRTPKVALESGRLWYLVRGSGSAYAVVDSHLVVAGPLHGAVMTQWDGEPDQWRWIRHDLGAYQGHRAHVEFTPKTADGEFAIARVVEAELAPALPTRFSAGRMNAMLLVAIGDKSVTSVPELSAAYQELFSRVGATLAKDDFSKTDSAEDFASLADWLARRPELFVETTSAEADRIAAAAQTLIERRADLVGHIKAESHTALAMFDGNGVDEQLLIRGRPGSPGESIPRRSLEALGGAPADGYGHNSGRLLLARQMLDDGNPLTARVIVNRVWQHLFGQGIVPTVDNFGVLGQPPSHPELLDCLARDFRAEQAWSIKRLIKSLVLSKTYQMSSAADPRSSQLDPTNALLQHMPIRRLEGEIIRDAILAVSGRLDRTLLGPSVEVHLTPFMEGRGRPGSGPLDGHGRRSVYTKVRRNFLPPMMLAFDMPIPFSTFGKRSVSNVPAQALIMMNDPLVVEQAKVWARRALSQATSPEERIAAMYVDAFARLPRGDESQAALEFLNEQCTQYGVADDKRNLDERAWADLAHVLFNTKEFIFIK